MADADEDISKVDAAPVKFQLNASQVIQFDRTKSMAEFQTRACVAHTGV